MEEFPRTIRALPLSPAAGERAGERGLLFRLPLPLTHFEYIFHFTPALNALNRSYSPTNDHLLLSLYSTL